MTARAIAIRGTSYPLVLPNIRDPRLHVAAVIITVHVLGQVGLRFVVSVPQILAAILTCAVIEIVLTFRSSRAFVWPASAMLTGSGVALILRVVGTPVDDHWTTYAWPLFAAIAGLSLLSKYVIRYRGSHVFNPSNVGLVVAFLVLGPSRVEPLDFWWAPLNGWMLAAYAVIVVGGLLITRRLALLELAVTFWLVFAAGLGVLAASGHCMIARWAFAPVCGADFWRVIVISPEVFIFLLFMITDPKTVPAGRVGRIVFGTLTALASVLLMAPQGDEFGAKVGLLSGLVLVCAARPLIDRIVPTPKTAADDIRRIISRAVAIGGQGGGAETAGRAPGDAFRVIARLGVAGLAVLGLGAGIVLAGTPARGVVIASGSEMLDRLPVAVDPATLPPITVAQDVLDFDHELAGPKMQQVAISLAQNLELENQALLQGDGALLIAVDHGDRLVEMQDRLAQATASDVIPVSHYEFDAIDVTLLVPFGRQESLSLGLTGRGTVIEETYDADGKRLSRTTSPFELTFALRQATGSRWLNVAVLPAGSSGG